jgi:hypothetical protein
VKELLSHSPAVIISGLGAAPKFQASLLHPVTMDQPTICGDSMGVLLTALRELTQENKLNTRPFLAIVSTTGISPTRDVPWLLVPLYRIALHTPHVDKKKMESALIEEGLKKDSALAGFATVRASLLTSGASKGLKAVRVGWERHASDPSLETTPGPAIGYFISRADVGKWIFESIIQTQGGEWNRRLVTVTH